MKMPEITRKSITTPLKIFAIVLLAASILLNIFTQFLPLVRYYGSSMEPTLQDGQLLAVWKTDQIQNGDIIAFYYNNSILIRRVIASGGEQITVDVFGEVSVNGQKLEEDYVTEKTLGQSNTEFPYYVPKDSYFVMGDDRTRSMDSRLQEIGAIEKSRIIGKVLFKDLWLKSTDTIS